MRHKLEGKRRVGKPKLRKMDEVTDNMRNLGAKNWREVMKNGELQRTGLKKVEDRIRL